MLYLCSCDIPWQEKWKVQQEGSSLRAAQQALEQERIHLMEVIQRERVEIEKSKVLLFIVI